MLKEESSDVGWSSACDQTLQSKIGDKAVMYLCGNATSIFNNCAQ